MATKAKPTKATRKPPPSQKVEDKAQYERFREFARDVEADETPEAFERMFRKVVPPATRSSRLK